MTDISDSAETDNATIDYVADDATEDDLRPLRDTLAGDLRSKFEDAKSYRRSAEDKWMDAYNNFKGEYSAGTQFTASERSRVFIKITKTKTIAAFGGILDVVFSGDNLPITIEATKEPIGIADVMHVDPNDPKEGEGEEKEQTGSILGFPGDGKDLKPGETLTSKTGPKLARFLPDFIKLKEGPSSNPKAVEMRPAEEAAKKMNKTIHDQMEETDLQTHISNAVLGACLYGTGIIKGPFAVDKEYPRWTEDGRYDPIQKTVPKSNAVSIWNLYPDPEAVKVEDCDFIFERHKMSRSKLRALKRRPYFRSSAINDLLDGLAVGAYEPEWWEDQLDDSHTSTNHTDSFEVLEYWGVIETKYLEENGIEISDDLMEQEEVEANIWLCGDQLLRVVFNPYKPAKKPYHKFCYEEDPHNFWGIGIPENMDDSQLLMNGFMRMAVDNAVLSGNMVIEVDETNLVPGQSLEMEPGKVFRRAGGPPGQAIFGTKFPNTTQENMLMFDKARQLADESTGIPSFAHGQTGVSGMGRTAAGMSMLFGAASLNTKTVIKNMDKDMFKPIGEAYFAFNMQFNFDPAIKGDLEVRARGTSSLMRKEVKSQRLLQFMQIAANSPLAPFVNFNTILSDLAHSLELDSDRLINNPEDAKLQALVMSMMGQKAEGSGGNGTTNNPSAAQGLNDPTGGGGQNIGVGTAPSPGDDGGQPTQEGMM